LRRRALVDSVRGPGGGYRLARDMAQISVADVILAVDEPIDATQCRGKENCQDDMKCSTHDLWAKLNEHILGYLCSVSLRQVVEAQKARATEVMPVQDMRDALPKREPVTLSS
jgi:Rrf2 family transcriptional regulator, iron-sulfur cluster assembly transcription factor